MALIREWARAGNVTLLTLALGFSDSALSVGPHEAATSAETDRSDPIDAGWWSQAQRNLARYEYRPSNNSTGLQAPNRAHNLRTYFDANGVRIYDRSAGGAPGLLRLSLCGLGRDGALEPLEVGSMKHTDARVEIHRPRVTEWYKNSVRGLEQGFDLATCMPGHGSLVLELAVAHACASLHGKSIEFVTDPLNWDLSPGFRQR